LGALGNVIDVNEFIQYVGALIALINPISKVPVMLMMTEGSAGRRRSVAFVASLTVLVALGVASLLGREILLFFAISADLFRTAGGIIVLLIGISMVRSEGPPDHFPDVGGPNPAIVPLGIPLLAGPGAIATVILYAGHHHNTVANTVAHISGIAVVTLITLVCLLAAAPIERVLGKNGMRIATQVMGLILAAIGVQMIVGGLSDHFGLVPAHPIDPPGL
jgi:multiple antibiotic resistance protein